MPWFLTVMILLGGCAAKKLPPYPVQAASSYPYFQVQDGLAIGIKPLTDPQESEKYFDTDLLSRGVLAIYVSAENQGAPGTFVLLEERFTLQTGLREEHQVSDREQPGSSSLAAAHTVMSGLAAIGSLFYLVGGIPFATVAGSINAHEERVKIKFVTEELQAKTISLGEEAHGFVYFRRPQGFPGPGQWILHLEAEDTNSKEVKTFDFILNKS